MKSIGTLGGFLMRGFVVSALMLPIFVAPAYAYIDPGTGTLILQAIVAAVAGALAYVTMTYGRVKTFISRLLGRAPEAEDNEDGGTR